MAAIANEPDHATTRHSESPVGLEPRAASARYDSDLGHIIIELTSGGVFSFPTQLVQGLADATDAQLASIEILGQGYGLHWNSLDVDYSVPSLLAGRFGTRAYQGLSGRRLPADGDSFTDKADRRSEFDVRA